LKIRKLRMDFAMVGPHWTRNPEFAQSQNAASLMPVHVEPCLLLPTCDPRRTWAEPRGIQEFMRRIEIDYAAKPASADSVGPTA